jgi:hypothetical protein
VFDVTELLVHVVEVFPFMVYEIDLRGFCQSTFQDNVRVSYSHGVCSNIRENPIFCGISLQSFIIKLLAPVSANFADCRVQIVLSLTSKN